MPNKNGLHLITPTSIASTGTGNSSSISANGSVTFSTCATLALNGVFSADYDNYMIVARMTGSTTGDISIRLRASGTNNQTASSYVSQYLQANSTTVAGYRTAANTFGLYGYIRGTTQTGKVTYIYGPYLAQPTAWRTVVADDGSGAEIIDVANTHNQSTAYDGFWLEPNGFTFSGRIAVYGLRK